MSATPETDKAERMAFSSEYMVPTEFARKLERERDEAQNKLDAVRKSHDIVTTHFREAERERDEAREERDIALLEAEEISQELANARKQIEGLNNFANERFEEAHSIADELADIASHCLGWHDHESVETAEKITNALKRWRNLKTK